MTRCHPASHKATPPRAAWGGLRRGVLVAFALCVAATAHGQDIEAEQLEQLENLVTIAWYFSLFCAFAMGFRAGLAR